MEVATGGKGKPPAFSELFNRRCEELGLMSAPEIAQRIIDIQPATANVDLARSVRNWQAGRNVPRSDFYRIILRALEIDDEVARTIWHPAYGEAKAASRLPVNEDKKPDLEVETRDGAGAPSSPDEIPIVGSRIRWRAGVGLSFLLIAAGGSYALYAGSVDYGTLCDASAGAGWDPDRNKDFLQMDLIEIRSSAMEACEQAVRQHPSIGRYWFQLGRAYYRDAKWHGNYERSYDAFLRAHELGSKAAALSLGTIFEEGLIDSGESLDHDLREAAKFYEIAAAANLPKGLYCHAISMVFGRSGKAPSPSEAIVYARAAVAAGSRRAVGLLADLTARKDTTSHSQCSRNSNGQHELQPIRWESGSAEEPAQLR